MITSRLYHLIFSLIFLSLVACGPVIGIHNVSHLSVAKDWQPATRFNIGNVTTNDTILLSKKITTPIGVLVALFALVTYGFTIKYSTPLSNKILLPSKVLSENVAAVLSPFWPRRARSAGERRPGNSSDRRDWVLLYKSLIPRSGEVHEAIHYCDDKWGPGISKPDTGHQPEVFALETFSPIMRNVVQIMIWNHATFWMVMAMIANTVVYNGFATKNLTNDSIIRLILVGGYAAMNLGLQYRSSILLCRNFTLALFQACWVVIFSEFVSHQRTISFPWMNDSSFRELNALLAFNLQLFGATERANAATTRPDNGGPTPSSLAADSEWDEIVRYVSNLIYPQSRCATDTSAIWDS